MEKMTLTCVCQPWHPCACGQSCMKPFHGHKYIELFCSCLCTLILELHMLETTTHTIGIATKSKEFGISCVWTREGSGISCCMFMRH